MCIRDRLLELGSGLLRSVGAGAMVGAPWSTAWAARASDGRLLDLHRLPLGLELISAEAVWRGPEGAVGARASRSDRSWFRLDF